MTLHDLETTKMLATKNRENKLRRKESNQTLVSPCSRNQQWVQAAFYEATIRAITGRKKQAKHYQTVYHYKHTPYTSRSKVVSRGTPSRDGAGGDYSNCSAGGHWETWAIWSSAFCQNWTSVLPKMGLGTCFELFVDVIWIVRAKCFLFRSID